MSYVQCSDGYKLKCDKCGAELHKERELNHILHLIL